MNKNDREIVFKKFDGHCAYCGCEIPLKGWHLDHIKPIRRIYKTVQGKTSWSSRDVCVGMENPELDCVENAYPSCAKCNINKHGDSIEEFRSNIQRYLSSLNLRMVQYQMVKKYGLVKETGIEVKFYFETFNPIQSLYEKLSDMDKEDLWNVHNNQPVDIGDFICGWGKLLRMELIKKHGAEKFILSEKGKMMISYLMNSI